MKIAVLNDTHAGIRNSSDIWINYQEKFYTEIFFPYLRENGIKKIIHLGDYYENRRFINFKALHANRKHFLEKLREYGITMDIIPGNHDTYYKNTNELNSLKELLGHYMNEVDIITEPRVVNYDGLKFAFIPWIAPDNEDIILNFLSQCDADIVGGHFELTGFDMMKGVACFDGMDRAILNRFPLVISGHFHSKSQQGNICYLGSQMEFFWNDVDDKKYFHVIDTDTKELTPIRNPITLYKKYDYYGDTDEVDLNEFADKFIKIIVKEKPCQLKFNKFLDKLQEVGPHEVKIIESNDNFMGDRISDSDVDLVNTEELINSYVEAVETQLDKERIKSEIQTLMIDAQTMELQ